MSTCTLHEKPTAPHSHIQIPVMFRKKAEYHPYTMVPIPAMSIKLQLFLLAGGVCTPRLQTQETKPCSLPMPFVV